MSRFAICASSRSQLGDCRTAIGDVGEQVPTPAFEGWVLATEWIGASDGAASGPRNPARATPRRPALLIAESEARAKRI